MKKFIIVLLIFIGSINIGNLSFGYQYNLFTVKKLELPDYVVLPATVISTKSIIISSKIMGYVENLKVDIGDRIKKGQVLLTIESKSTQDKINQAKADYDRADFVYKRFVKLYKQRVISKNDLIKAKSDYLKAKASLDDVLTLKRHSNIKAPFNGIVSRRFVQNGDLSMPSTPLLKIDSTDGFFIDFFVPDTVFSYIQRKKFITTKIGGMIFKLPIAYRDLSEDSQTHTHEIKLLIKDIYNIHPGEFARVFIETSKNKRLVVPKNALVIRSMIKGVFVLNENGQVHFRIVRFGSDFKNFLIVLSGLNQGEKVLLDPPYWIKNGDTFKE